MEKFFIEGPNRLEGEVVISGAKNAAVAIIPAVLLADEPCVIENIPEINDVGISLQILKELGAKVKMLNRTTVEIDATHIISPSVPFDIARNMRASYYFLGALLGRYSKASVTMPGGCDFGGVRPIDQHIKGFEALGAKVSIDYGMITAEAEQVIGSHIYFDGVSVGATVNMMLAAVRAKGITILENVAKEPHVVDLANFLNAMGADVRGAGTDVIKIHGVEYMRGVTYSIIPDQIEAGTFMVAAAATGGNVLVKNVIPKHLESITAKLVAAGAVVEEFDDSIRVSSNRADLKKVNIKTQPHPGFPTDLQPQMTVLLTIAQGTSIVTEGIYDNRYKYVDEIRRMGAQVQVDGKVAVVEGTEYLTGAPVRATDLRAGAALIIAGLIAQGRTEVEEIYHIERGYENVVQKFKDLGANMVKVEVPETEIRAIG